MSGIQSKIARHAKKQENANHIEERNQLKDYTLQRER